MVDFDGVMVFTLKVFKGHAQICRVFRVLGLESPSNVSWISFRKGLFGMVDGVSAGGIVSHQYVNSFKVLGLLFGMS